MLDGDQEEKDWSTPEKYYIQAVDVFSEGAALASPGVIGIMLGTSFACEYWSADASNALSIIIQMSNAGLL